MRLVKAAKASPHAKFYNLSRLLTTTTVFLRANQTKFDRINSVNLLIFEIRSSCSQRKLQTTHFQVFDVQQTTNKSTSIFKAKWYHCVRKYPLLLQAFKIRDYAKEWVWFGWTGGYVIIIIIITGQRCKRICYR